MPASCQWQCEVAHLVVSFFWYLRSLSHFLLIWRSNALTVIDHTVWTKFIMVDSEFIVTYAWVAAWVAGSNAALLIAQVQIELVVQQPIGCIAMHCNACNWWMQADYIICQLHNVNDASLSLICPQSILKEGIIKGKPEHYWSTCICYLKITYICSLKLLYVLKNRWHNVDKGIANWLRNDYKLLVAWSFDRVAVTSSIRVRVLLWIPAIYEEWYSVKLLIGDIRWWHMVAVAVHALTKQMPVDVRCGWTSFYWNLSASHHLHWHPSGRSDTNTITENEKKDSPKSPEGDIKQSSSGGAG
jgi:hypothetical protein